MVTKTIELKTFDELSPELREKVIENNFDINVEFDWWEFIYEDAKAIGEILGIEIKDIYFSGFWSQGDGACFTGSYSYNKGSRKAIRNYAPEDKELHRIADGLFELQRRYFYALSANIGRGHLSNLYSHSGTMSVDVSDDRQYYDNLSPDDVDTLESLMRDFADWIYIRLEKEYDYLMEWEQVAETLRINEYLFNEDGKIDYV